jgi:site-specific DNA recombinase
MTTAAIYARVSSASQKEEETIVSQTAALKGYAISLGLVVPSDWIFEDEGSAIRQWCAKNPVSSDAAQL